MRDESRSSVLISVLIFVLSFGLLVQPTATAYAQLAPRDSLRILDQAHAAQFRFETARRMNLPRVQPSAQHSCDAVIGRMCYWNDDEDAAGSDTTPITEPASIFRARQRLISTLDKLSALLPADTWIAGQRVHYLVESGSDSAALSAAHQCRSAKWWCAVLTGYALHSAGDYAAAEVAYDSALAAMPSAVRCKWSDIALLLGDDERDRYEHIPCESRGATEAKFWKLAQPSYAVHGNDRRTEHFSRVFLAELSASSTNAYGIPWGDDMREILIRYGQPLWYATNWATGFEGTPTIGHDRRHSYHFAATIEGDSTRWDVRSAAARERYAPPYMDSIANLDAQFAMVKRGDSAMVLVVYADSSSNAVLGLANDLGTTTVTRDSASRARIRTARTAWKGVVAGIEEYDPVKRVDTRARTWIAPPTAAPGAPELSTLIFFAGDTSSAAGSLDDALQHALSANQLRGNRKLGLYWEMYGASAARRSNDSPVMDSSATDSIAKDSSIKDSTASDSSNRSIAAPPQDVSITVTRTDGGVLKWLAQTLRISPKDSRIAMQWHESQLGSGITARSVVLDLAQLPAGTYQIALAAGPDSRHRTTTSREIRLR